MMIFFALMIALGVVFGTGAIVLDGGYGMGQQTVMQTSADAGAMAGAKVLASSVVSSPPVVYLASDSDVGTASTNFTNANNAPIAATEYVIWSGSYSTGSCPTTPPSLSSTVTRYFTTSSKFAALGTQPPGTSWNHVTSVPNDTCALRVYTSTTFNSIFAEVPPINVAQQTVVAVATARIFPANPPTTITNTWPITHFEGDTCTYTPGSPCTFWGNSGTNFKQLVNFSEDSPIAAATKPLATWTLQHMDAWDPTYPGTNQANPAEDDWDNWFLFGFHGQLNVADSNCSNLTTGLPNSTWTLTPPPPNCKNSRVERYGGNHGSNIAQDIYAYIDGCNASGSWNGPGNNPCSASPGGFTKLLPHYEGFDSSIGNYVTMHVFLWKYAEENLDPKVDLGRTLTNTPTSAVDRVILDDVQCFRFGDGQDQSGKTIKNVLNSSNVQGYWVSCPATDISGNGPPITTANAVRLVA
jgi:hypothetical protein